MKLYAKGSSQESYSTQYFNGLYNQFATANGNEDGSVAFKFNYESTNPESNEYGAQVFIRLRGTASNCYRFSIGKIIGDHVVGVSFG